MSLARTLLRQQSRADFRANEIVEGKCKVGKTNKLRLALAGNNPSVGKRAFQAQKKYGRMVKHARLVVALLIRATGGEAETVPTVTAREQRLSKLAFMQAYASADVVPSKPKKGKSHKAIESRGQRIARKGKVERANKEVLAKLLAGEYGPAGKPREVV